MTAATVCAEAGCGQPAVYEGRCIAHYERKPRGSTWRWRALRAQAIERDHGICQICHEPGADSADHIIPAADGGPDELWNLRAAHLSCNVRRGR